MSTHAAASAVDPLSKPIEWAKGMLVGAASLFVVSMLLGGVLYYLWPALAAAFGPLDQVGGYWNNTLFGLGLLAVLTIVAAMRSDLRLNPFDAVASSEARAGLVEAASGLGMFLLVAWIIVEFLR